MMAGFIKHELRVGVLREVCPHGDDRVAVASVFDPAVLGPKVELDPKMSLFIVHVVRPAGELTRK